MRSILILMLCVGLMVPAASQISKLEKLKKEVDEILDANDLSRDDLSDGLKEALIKGVKNGADKASETNGFYKNQAIKIPFPKNAKKVAKSLRKIGMDKQVDEFVKTLNRSAELAAKEAKPIFVDAVKDMSIEDAWSIVNGKDNKAATNYLQEKTTAKLAEKITPIIEEKLETTNATRYYGDLVKRYNQLPFVEKQDTDLTKYATNQTIKGLFYLVGQEELKIRENPGERTSELLGKVFKLQD